MQFGLDFDSLNRSYQFFYGHSLIYLVIAAFFVIGRISYTEKSNRTSNTYLISKISRMLIAQCVAIALYSSLNVLVFDFGLSEGVIVDRLFLILTFLILFFNSIFPYYVFIVLRKQLRNIGFFQGFVNKIAFILVTVFCVSYLGFVLKLLIYSSEVLATPFCKIYFKIVMCLALSQIVCFFLTMKDVHVFVAELMHGAFYSKKAQITGLVLFCYAPVILWPLSVVYILPIFFIAMVSFIFVVHMISQSRAVSRDFLTNMNNRNELYRYLSRLFEKFDDLTPALNLIFIDINKFKSINDTFGHSQGDKALICMANCLRRSAFEKDCFLSRYAGDEFIVVIKESGENTVARFIENLNSNIDSANSTNTDPYKLSIAVGAVSYSESYDTVEKFIEAADRKMYEMKEESDKKARAML